MLQNWCKRKKVPNVNLSDKILGGSGDSYDTKKKLIIILSKNLLIQTEAWKTCEAAHVGKL